MYYYISFNLYIESLFILKNSISEKNSISNINRLDF